MWCKDWQVSYFYQNNMFRLGQFFHAFFVIYRSHQIYLTNADFTDRPGDVNILYHKRRPLRTRINNPRKHSLESFRHIVTFPWIKVVGTVRTVWPQKIGTQTLVLLGAFCRWNSRARDVAVLSLLKLQRRTAHSNDSKDSYCLYRPSSSVLPAPLKKITKNSL
jgi:hypothetical protein